MLTRGNELRRPAGGGPVMTVVTVVRNGEHYLEKTIQSVIDQTYDAVELIIIDGGSTDGTLDIIRRYDPQIEYWSSEPDKGIYDAMNKGIDRATGEWIIFLNAGDMFADIDILSNIIKDIPSDAEIVYGDHQEVYGNGYSATRVASTISDLWKGMPFSHQAMFVKTSLLRQRRFNVSSRISADYEFIYMLYQQRRLFHHVPIIIARVLADGFSASQNLRMTLDQWRIARHYSGRTVSLECYYAFTFIRIMCNNLLKAVLPKRLVNYLRSR